MACIGKIAANLAMPCGAPARADLGRPVSAKLINASDIASFTVDGSTGLATITRVTGARGWNITGINNSLVVTVGMKSQDITAAAYDVAITFKNFSGAYALASNAVPMGIVGPAARAELVIAVDHGDVVRVYGLGVPLVCTEMSGGFKRERIYNLHLWR